MVTAAYVKYPLLFTSRKSASSAAGKDPPLVRPGIPNLGF